MIAILIPVLGRADRINPLLKNIAEVTPEEHRVIFLCSPGDPATEVCVLAASEERCETEVMTWEPDRADFAKKVNFAFTKLAPADWYFQGATDIVFHEGWATRAMHMASTSGAGVIGTNDLGNTLVKSGRHSTHTFFSRHYIETHGGSYDDSGIVFCELYDHEFVDTEFVQIAIARGQFAACRRSIVEHMHPHWNKGEYDDTYTKAIKEFKQDAVIYHARMRTFKQLQRGRRQ